MTTATTADSAATNSSGQPHHLPANSTGATVSERLRTAIDSMPQDGVKLAELRDMFGQDGLMVFTIFLVIPFMVPVSIPGVSTVFGAAILLIGFCRLFRRRLWLPKRFANRVLPSDKLRLALTKGLAFFQRLERFTKPRRMQILASETVASLSLILGAILLMAPFGLIPFSNTLPGIALMFLALGILQRDGASILLGHLVNLATIIYFAFLIAAGGGLIYMLFHRSTAQ